MHPDKTDFASGLRGLFIGAITVVLIMFAIVQMVNAKHAHKPEAGQVGH
jgi:hypothetical protein